MNDNELVNTRIINASRERVFEAWMDQDNIGKWFGPDGFSITTTKMDAQAGGEWIFVMHGPDGVDYPSQIKYREVVKPDRLVLDYSETPEHNLKAFYAVITFEEAGEGKTKLTLRHIFENAEERVKQEGIGAVEGGNQTLNRLESYLAK